MVTAIGALLTALVVAVGKQLFPTPDVADRLRLGQPPIDVTVTPWATLSAVPGAASRDRLDTPALRPEIDGRAPGDLPVNLPIVAAGSMSISLELRGQRSAGVDIVGMRVRVLRQGPPLTGTILLGPGPQGASEKVVLETTVDDPVPRLAEAGSRQPYFTGHHVTLGLDELFLLTLAPAAARSSLQWDLAIEWVADGRIGTEYVGAGGVVTGDHDPRPFEITAVAPRLSDYGVVYAADSDMVYRLLTPDRYCAAEPALQAGRGISSSQPAPTGC
jgi:hypothetical protein